MLLIKTIIEFLKDRDYRNLLLTTIFILGLGAVAYRLLEGWTWLDSLYFSVITLTTVGYGDFSPQTDGGKIFTIFYIIVGIGIILGFINTIYNHYSNVRSSGRKNKKN